MLITCPEHNITYNTDTNSRCAICCMHPDIQVDEIKRMERFISNYEREILRREKNKTRYEAYNLQRREARKNEKTPETN